MPQLVQPGAVRAPRLRLLCAGQEVRGVIEAEVQQNSHYQADTWDARLALDLSGGLAFWDDNARIGQLLDVQASLDAGQSWTSLIQGAADKVRASAARGEVHLSGQDLTKRLIDLRLQDTFLNQTTSQIATILAGRCGLTPVVTATTTPVSRYYAEEHDRIAHGQFSRARTALDLLHELATFEGLDVFVKGSELHVQKPPDPGSATIWEASWDQVARVGSAEDFDFGRSLTLAGDVVVAVHSWHGRLGRGYVKYSPANGKSLAASGKATLIELRRANLTEDQAQRLADTRRAEVTRHERTVAITCPGELAATPRDMVRITGDAAAWGTTYFIGSIRRTISQGGGFGQTLECKTVSPSSEA